MMQGDYEKAAYCCGQGVNYLYSLHHVEDLKNFWGKLWKNIHRTAAFIADKIV